MRNITVTYIDDSHECDTCGYSYASGAIVKDDDTGEVILECIPVAYCFDSVTWERDDIYKMLFEKIGYINLKINYEENYGNSDEVCGDLDSGD